MSGYIHIPETTEDVFVTYTDWIAYTKDDGTYGFLVKNGVPTPITWAGVTGKPTTFPATLGTTSLTAKAGNYKPTWSEINSVIPSYATFPPILGTSSVSAKAGNWYPSWEEIYNKPETYPTASVTWAQVTDRPSTLSGYGIQNGVSSASLAETLNYYATELNMYNELDLKAQDPQGVAALGSPTLVPTVDIQTLYDKVNELLVALKG